jgi:ABC-type Fe3+/spermidine/putrescine transport system ATPase subunit
MPSVRLVDVVKRFGTVTAINRLSVEIPSGEYVCILGPTGSGKTTLLKLIAGLNVPDEGEIYIDGKSVIEVPPEERGAVYVPQQYALFPHLTVLQNVAFGPFSHGIGEKEALDTARTMLEMMKLEHRADSRPDELSGGMQQRVALARGLATKAELLLLDEPLGALDARLRVELRDKLRQLAKDSGVTVIHVTHDQAEATSIGDQIIVLRDGRIRQYATPFHVYMRPQSLFVAHFVGGASFLQAIVVERHPQGSVLEVHGGLLVRVQDSTYLPGEEVVLVIREDDVKIVESNDQVESNSYNVIEGEIQSSRFLGGFVSEQIRLVNGDFLTSKTPTIRQEKEFPTGRRIFACFKPSDTMVYSYPPIGLSRELRVM